MARHKRRRWYQALHREGGAVRSLGRVPDVTPHGRSLDPFLSRLRLAGVEGGELLLVDEATGHDVALRVVRPRGHPIAATGEGG